MMSKKKIPTTPSNSQLDSEPLPPSVPNSLQSGIFTSSNLQALSQSEQELVDLLLGLGQKHVFEKWDRLGVNDDKKHAFLAQVARLDSAYPGGLRGYITNARKLLADAKEGVNPFDGWTPTMPVGTSLIPADWSYQWHEGSGLLELPHTGFVLVAGGLGERLGYGDIKIGLPVESVTKVTYLEYYCRCIKAMQERYCKRGQELPLAIMVSGDTIKGTQAAVEKVSSWFPNITLMLQEKVAALVDNSCTLAMAGPYEIDAKPHGHGDVHCLMHSTGTARSWQQRGIKWCVFFQDTNALAFHTLPAMLGVSQSKHLEVNSLTVPRVAKQAVGAIVKLRHTDGKEMTINVEYNQLDPLLRATTSPQGDVNDPSTGTSPFPGNINQLVFRMDPYCASLDRTQGLLAEFVNPKYADDKKEKFKKPTRLECMMQDYPKVLPPQAAHSVGFTQAPAWLCYSPCKNNAPDAAASIAAGVPAGAAWTAESDQYFCKAELLRLLGCSVDKADSAAFLGITATPGPRVVVDPSTALFFSELRGVFPSPGKVHLSARSSLVLSGDVVVESLELDGRLRVVAVPGTRIIVRAGLAEGRQIRNAGDRLRDIGTSASSSSSSQPSTGASAGTNGNMSSSGRSSSGSPFGSMSTRITSSPDRAKNGQAAGSGYSEVDRMRGFVLEVEEEQHVTSLNAPARDGEGASGGEGCSELCGCATWHDSDDRVSKGRVFVYNGGVGGELVPLHTHDHDLCCGLAESLWCCCQR